LSGTAGGLGACGATLGYGGLFAGAAAAGAAIGRSIDYFAANNGISHELASAIPHFSHSCGRNRQQQGETGAFLSSGTGYQPKNVAGKYYTLSILKL
jgi:hypothetical protein